jgi:hypothetical protein
VRHDPAVELEDDVEPTDRVLPVLLREPLVLVIPEGGVEHGADDLDLVRGQPIRGDAPDADGRIAIRAGCAGHDRTLARRRSLDGPTTLRRGNEVPPDRLREP